MLLKNCILLQLLMQESKAMIKVNCVHLSSNAEFMRFNWQKQEHNSATHIGRTCITYCSNSNIVIADILQI